MISHTMVLVVLLISGTSGIISHTVVLGLCWWAFAASRVPQFSAPVFLACFRVSWSRPAGRALHGVVA